MKSLNVEKMESLHGGFRSCFAEGFAYLDAMAADYNWLYYPRLAVTLGTLMDCLNEM